MKVIVYGPQGCGKTTNAQKIRRFYNLTKIVDGWDGESKLPDGALALCNEMPPPKKQQMADVIAFKDVMKRIK